MGNILFALELGDTGKHTIIVFLFSLLCLQVLKVTAIKINPFYFREGGQRGLSGTFQNGASGMLPPKLRHILECLAFSDICFVKKKDPTLVKSLFENTIGNPFFDFFFLNIDQNSSKKIQNRNMGFFFSNLLSKSIF